MAAMRKQQHLQPQDPAATTLAEEIAESWRQEQRAKAADERRAAKREQASVERFKYTAEKNHRMRVSKPSVRTSDAGRPSHRGKVRFRDPIATTLLFTKEEPAAAVGEKACADSGASTNLNRQSTARAVGLPSAGPSNTYVMGFDGSIKRAEEKMTMPYTVPAEHRNGEIMDDGDLNDNLTSVKKFADAGLVSIFHPGEEGFTAYNRADVNITYSAPPVIEDTAKSAHGAPNSGVCRIGNQGRGKSLGMHSPHRPWPDRILSTACKHSYGRKVKPNELIVFTISPPSNKPSIGCTRCWDTRRRPLGSRHVGPEISEVSHSTM